MAENLGEARLQLTVDLDAFRRGLRDARALVESELRGAGAGGGRRSADTSERRREQDQRRRQRELLREQRDNQREIDRRARQGGPTENTRALEIAQEKRFRIARRIDALEERGADVSRLRNRLGQLTEAQSARQFGTFRQISRELARQVVLVERRQQAAERVARAERQLASIGARQGGARESVFALERVQDRRFRISQRINRLEETGTNVSQLRTKLGELTTSQANRQFGTFRQISRELERQVSLTEARARRERDVQRVLDRRARAGGPSSPIAGSVLIPGSPAFNRAQERASQQDLARGARLGGARSPIGGSVLIPGSPAFLQEQQKLLRQQEQAQLAAIRASARSGGARSPLAGSVLIPGSPAFVREQQRAAASQLTQSARIGGPSLPISGRLSNGTVIPGSPASRLAAQREYERSLIDLTRAQRQEAKAGQRRLQALGGRASEALGSGIIGGAFPALFGQGLGASIGGGVLGGVGGALGGQFGFGLSLVGTAVGQTFDQMLEKGRALAEGLRDPITNFKNLSEAGITSSRSFDRTIESLIASGRQAEAYALIQQDLARFGSGNGLTQLNEAFDSLKRRFSELGIVIAQFVGGPLSDFLNKVAASLKVFSLNAQVQGRLAQLTPAQRNQVEAAGRARGGQLSGTGVTIAEAGVEINLAKLAAIEKIAGKTKEEIKAEAALASARKLYNDQLANSKRLIDAKYSGSEREVKLEERKKILLDLSNKTFGLSAQDPKVLQANQEASEALYENTKSLEKLDRERAAAFQLQNVESGLALQAVQQRITAAKELASVEAGVVRQTIQQRQEIEAGVQASKDQIARIGAQIDALRLQGGDNGPQLQKLVDEQKVAATEIRLKLIEGATALKDAGKQLKQDLGGAVLELAGIRNDPGGLNQYLNQQQIQERGQATLQSLLPQFREAQGRFSQLTGAQAPEFRGTTSGVVDSVRQFIEQVKREDQAGQNVANLQEALNKNTADLVSVNNELLSVTRALAEKSWAVNVNVPGGTASGDVIGAVNGAF